MPLTFCLDCNKPVLIQALVCPHCGASASGGLSTSDACGPPTVSMTHTPKKSAGHPLLAPTLMVVGLGAACTDDLLAVASGALLILLGLVWWVAARLLAGWPHG